MVNKAPFGWKMETLTIFRFNDRSITAKQLIYLLYRLIVIIVPALNALHANIQSDTIVMQISSYQYPTLLVLFSPPLIL